jgi:2-phospho-L-lactate guanylyltransferase (CobY/MobA/RfbA family)
MAQAVIAVRGGPGAKSRCADAPDGPERARLTAAMLQDMLAAVSRCDVTANWAVTPTLGAANKLSWRFDNPGSLPERCQLSCEIKGISARSGRSQGSMSGGEQC